MVEIFKTNVQHSHQAIMLISILSRQYANLLVNFDLDDCDKILRVEGESISLDGICHLLEANGYLCEVLE